MSQLRPCPSVLQGANHAVQELGFNVPGGPRLGKLLQLRRSPLDKWTPTFERRIAPRGPLTPRAGLVIVGPSSWLDTIHGQGENDARCQGGKWDPSGSRSVDPSETSLHTQATPKWGILPRARYPPPLRSPRNLIRSAQPGVFPRTPFSPTLGYSAHWAPAFGDR